MDDMFLLQLIKNGDKQAFKYVFDTYFTALCRFMYLYLGVYTRSGRYSK